MSIFVIPQGGRLTVPPFLTHVLQWKTPETLLNPRLACLSKSDLTSPAQLLCDPATFLNQDWRNLWLVSFAKRFMPWSCLSHAAHGSATEAVRRRRFTKNTSTGIFEHMGTGFFCIVPRCWLEVDEDHGVDGVEGAGFVEHLWGHAII
jgi:hypothetical protein